MGPCPGCRHVLALHIGEDQCPVCRLVGSPAMRPDMLIEATRNMLTVLRPGEVLLVRIAPYIEQASVDEYQARITSLMERAGLTNAVLFLYGEEFAVMSSSRELAMIESMLDKEGKNEQGKTEQAEAKPEARRGPLGDVPPAPAGPETPGPLPAGELLPVPPAEPAPAGNGEGRGSEAAEPLGSEGLAEPAAGGEGTPDQGAAGDPGTGTARPQRRPRRH